MDEVAEYTVDYCYRVSDMPSLYSPATHCPEADEWHKAMSDEIKGLGENDTFELVPPPDGPEVVGVGGFILLKQDSRRQRLSKSVMYGRVISIQIPGIDYHGTFTPTARMSSIRVLLQYEVQNYTPVQNATLP